jgi:hypothetical protein
MCHVIEVNCNCILGEKLCTLNADLGILCDNCRLLSMLSFILICAISFFRLLLDLVDAASLVRLIDLCSYYLTEAERFCFIALAHFFERLDVALGGNLDRVEQAWFYDHI